MFSAKVISNFIWDDVTLMIKALNVTLVLGPTFHCFFEYYYHKVDLLFT
jgi:hypothetical protein